MFNARTFDSDRYLDCANSVVVKVAHASRFGSRDFTRRRHKVGQVNQSIGERIAEYVFASFG